jgi:hypothetical protein
LLRLFLIGTGRTSRVAQYVLVTVLSLLPRWSGAPFQSGSGHRMGTGQCAASSPGSRTFGRTATARIRLVCAPVPALSLFFRTHRGMKIAARMWSMAMIPWILSARKQAALPPGALADWSDRQVDMRNYVCRSILVTICGPPGAAPRSFRSRRPHGRR